MTLTRLFVLTVLIGLMALSAVVFAERPTNVEASPKDLALSISSGKSSFVLYEPVYVTTTLTNPTSSYIISDLMGLSVMEQQMKFSVQEGDGAPVEYVSELILDFPGGRHTEHGPAEAIVDTNLLFYNGRTRQLAFPRTGHYTIYGKVYLGNYPDPVYAKAQPLGIDVVDPKSADDSVIESIGSKERLIEVIHEGGWTYCRDTSNEECVDKTQALMRQYPNSAYVPVIVYGVAYVLGRDGPRGRAYYAGEADLLKDFLKCWPNHPLVPGVTSSLARSFYKAGKLKEANEWIERFEKAYPGRESPRKVIEKGSRGL